MLSIKTRLLIISLFSFAFISVFFSNCSKIDFEKVPVAPAPTVSNAIKEMCYDSYSSGDTGSSVAGGCVPEQYRSCEGAGDLAPGQVACWGWHDQGADGNKADFDPRMCRQVDGYLTVKDGHGNESCGAYSTGCEILASKCSSGRAIAVQVDTSGDSCFDASWVYECI